MSGGSFLFARKTLSPLCNFRARASNFSRFFFFFFFFIVRLITIPPFVISISHSYVEIQSRRSLSTEHDELSLPSFIEFEGPPLFQTPILPSGCTGIRNIEGRRESKRSRESPCNDSYTEIFQRLYRDDSGRVRGFIAGPVI